MGWRLLAIAHNLSYSSEFTTTMRILHRMLAQNEQVQVQCPQTLVLGFPNHNRVTLFDLKVLSNSF